jgi:Domain of unknown function (DUF4276)
VSGVAIYLEGGGDAAGTKTALRLGMDAFLRPLKDAARAKSLHWKVVCCGGRNQAFDGFENARRTGEAAIIILLVDAEAHVTTTPAAHLTARDGWNLAGVAADMVHLMTQMMETWIVADPEALAAYYRQDFNRNALPRAQNLEDVAKNDITNALEQATRQTQKGVYHKTRHAGDLLKGIATSKVRQRCPRCNRLFIDVGAAIGRA